jgi:PAS domain S-box-containing protein
MSSTPALSAFARALEHGTRAGDPTSRSLGAALQALCLEATSALSAARTSVWLHDRRVRELVLTASSDAAFSAPRIPSDDPGTVARGMRLDQPQSMSEPGAPVIVAPLRGWRRALGTLVVEGRRAAEPADPERLELTEELARHVSTAIENVQLLEEVLRQRRLIEDTFNSLADLVIVTDRALRIVQVNDVFVERIGKSRRELFEQGLAEYLGSEIARWVDDADGGTEAASERSGRSRTFEDARLGGTFAATVTPLINEDGQPVGRVIVARDITAQVRLEAEREALRARLAQSEKLAALGQFVAGIAHEMNNPLQGVLGHLELLIDTSEDARPLRPELRRIYQEADRAAKIVRNLLVFTGARRMNRRRLKIDRVIARALASRNAALTRSGIEVVQQSEGSMPAIAGDPLLLQQAMLNVLINAEHAIAQAGGAGRIEISTRVAKSGETVVTSIRDTGSGFPSDVLPKIFDPFFTTKDVGQGTGLGLAITYGIIQELGGTIHAENAPDGGAIMTIELPALQSPVKYSANG